MPSLYQTVQIFRHSLPVPQVNPIEALSTSALASLLTQIEAEVGSAFGGVAALFGVFKARLTDCRDGGGRPGRPAILGTAAACVCQ